MVIRIQLALFAKRLISRLSSAGHQHFRSITQPARPNRVTVTLTALPRSQPALITENAFLRQHRIVLHRHVKPLRQTWRAPVAAVPRTLGSHLKTRLADNTFANCDFSHF